MKGNYKMYIKEIYLENFSNIKTGLNQNYLHIDFSDRQHRICVLKGANGKGKTSLLSYLTPFATLGNLDVRDRHSLILKDKVGKKRITIIDNDGNSCLQAARHHGGNRKLEKLILDAIKNYKK